MEAGDFCDAFDDVDSVKGSKPGDSSRDLFIPDRWRSPTTFEFGSRFHHPKKVTKRIARKMDICEALP